MSNECIDFFCSCHNLPKNDTKECVHILHKLNRLKKEVVDDREIPIFCILKYPIVEQLIDKNTHVIDDKKMKEFMNLLDKYDFEVISYTEPVNLDIHFWNEHYINSLARKNDKRRDLIVEMIKYDLNDSLNIIMLIRYKKLSEKTKVNEIKKKKEKFRVELLEKYKFEFKTNLYIENAKKNDKENCEKYYKKHFIHFSDNILEIQREIKNLLNYLFLYQKLVTKIDNDSKIFMIYYFQYILNILKDKK